MTGQPTIPHLRLANQHLVGSALTTPTDVARSMLALQAQDFAAAKWAVGIRAPGITEGDVHGAFNRGEIVRSWPLRGTLQITSADDLPWLLALTAERMLASASTRHTGLGLDDRTLRHACDVALAHLSGGRASSRKQLLASFQSAGIATTGQRGYHILWWLAVRGVICLGPMHDGQQSFVLLNEWIPLPRLLGREEALGEVARRYFAARGPATERDLAWWAKLPLKDVRAAIAISHAHLQEWKHEGTTYYLSPDVSNLPGSIANAAAESVALLPAFDEYLLGYADRSAVLRAADTDRVAPGGNGVFQPIIVVGGRVEGTWRRSVTRAGVQLGFESFTGTSPSQGPRFEEAAAAYATFLGRDIQMRAGDE